MRPIWLGYRTTGGRFEIRYEDVRRGIAILGHGANDLALLFAQTCNEAGLITLVLDFDGEISEKASGYIDTYEPAYFLYDVLRVDENASVHGQLAASAYSCSLDLSFEQEGIVNTATQTIASERGVMSPTGLSDLMLERNEQFRGKPVDRLKARLGSLNVLNVVGETGTTKEILKRSAILDFSEIGQPEAVETAVALFIAKLLAMAHRGRNSKDNWKDDEVKAEGERDRRVDEVAADDEKGAQPSILPDVLIMAHANRLFRVRPIFRRTERLLTTFISSPIGKILASDSVYGIDEHFEETCSIKIISSSLWNEDRRKAQILLPNMFMVRHNPYGHDTPFIPRIFQPMKGGTKNRTEADARVAATPSQPDDPELVHVILQDIDLYDAPTRQSLLAFASQGYPREVVERTLDKLQNDGYFEVVTKGNVMSGPPINVLSLTAKGKAMLDMMPK